MRVIWLLKRSAWVSLCVFCAGLVLLAVVMSLARVALSRPQLLTPWAERVVEAAVDEPVVFESVRGRLDGFSPELALRGVRIGRGDRELGLDRLRLRLDSLASLWRGTAVLASLEVSGARVRVTRHADGDVRVQGRRESILSRLPLPQRVRFTDIDVDWRDKTSEDTPPLQLRSIALRGLRDGRHLRLAGTSELAAGGGAVELVARLATIPQSSDPFAGRIHVALEQVAAARLGKLVPRSAQQGAPIGGRVDGGVWLRWQAGKLTRATGQGRWSAPRLDGVAADGALTGRIRWQPDAGGWRVDAEGGMEDGQAPTRLSVARYPGSGWRLGVAELAVGQWLLGLAQRPDLPARLARLAEAVKPRGRIKRFQLAHQGGDWRAAGRVEGAAVAASASYPGISGLDLDFAVTPDRGRMVLAVAQGELAMPGYLRSPVVVTRADAELSWIHLDGDGKRWRLESLDFAGPLASGGASGTLSADADQGPRIDGRLRLDGADAAAMLARATPELLEQSSLDWLDERLERAELTGATVRAKGPIRQLTATGDDAMLRLRAGFRGATLDYAADWPALEAIAGDVTVTPGRVGLNVQRGATAGVAITSGSATIRGADDPRLSVSVQAESPFDTWMDYLRQTPLETPDFVGAINVRARPSVALRLEIPLAQEVLESWHVRMRFADARVTEPKTGYRLQQVTGAVDVGSDGIRWQGVSGRLGGRRFTTKGWSTSASFESRLRAVTSIHAAASELMPPGDARRQDWPMSGRADWLLALELPGPGTADGSWRAELSSDLAGLRVEAPAPLGKRATDARRFGVTVDGDAQDIGPLRLRYGQVLRGVGLIRAGRLTRGHLHFGDQAPERPSADGVQVTGSLGVVDADQIRAFTALLDQSGEAAPALPAMRRVELTLAALKVGGYTLHDVALQGEPDDDGWRVEIRGPHARGSLNRRQGGLWDLEMERLAVERSDGGQRVATDQPPELGDVDVHIDALRIDGRRLGQLRLSLRSDEAGMTLQELVVDNPRLLLRARGDWQRATNRSRLRLTAETVDAGWVLRLLEAGNGVDGGTGRLEAELAWDGHLLNPDSASLNGSVDLNLRDGSLPPLEPGPGRLLGLLSLSLLPRRLLLDFDAWTSEGLPFDRIRARFQVRDGVAYPDPLYLTGPVARIDVQGSVDLGSRVYDQRIRVTPDVSGPLPLVGALAGGPPAALLLLLGEDLVTRGMSPLTSVDYRLTGPWEQPTLERVNNGLWDNRMKQQP